MKIWLTATLAFALMIAAGVSVQADPPGGVPIPVPAPVVFKDGPYRLLLAAKAQARHRQDQGYRTEIANENGLWWVLCSH